MVILEEFARVTIQYHIRHFCEKLGGKLPWGGASWDESLARALNIQYKHYDSLGYRTPNTRSHVGIRRVFGVNSVGSDSSRQMLTSLFPVAAATL